MILKNKLLTYLTLVAVLLGIFSMLSVVGATEESARKIVVFKTGVLNEPAKDALLSKFGAVELKNLDLINARAVLLPPKAAKALAREAGVLRVDDDILVYATGRSTPQPAQSLPWGIDRVEADLVWGTTTGDPVKVAIVDTGIDLTHPDLALNIKGGYNAINPTKSANDDNGHGTHVAGIVAALNNNIGVVGMAPAADLYAVKVLNRNGSGYLSDIIEGLDWAIQNGMRVVNMSLGTTSNIQSFHDAIVRANQAGLVLVAAAGNDSGPVNFPAAYSEVIAVSATDSNNTLATWSSRGAEVDLAAPGVNIYSTYKGGAYKTLSGTSMATPHVTGAVALLLTATSKCDFNLDGNCDPAEVQSRLEATATDLGASGKDSLYGAGFLNVAQAILQ